jgi:hypothetical protein
MIQNPHDRVTAVYKQCEHNSCSVSPTVTVQPYVNSSSPVISFSSPVIPAFPPVIPAKAGIHCTSISAQSTKSDLVEYV